jgi:heat-inducible transcriptional repressor
MVITERQQEILNKIVEEYINSAEPVSSQLLEKKYDFGICPATIRIEMQKLTDAGFIFQPHTSAGRIPTDKGYRFFVDDLLEKGLSEKNYYSKIEDWFEGEIKDTVKFIQSLTKNLASFSSNLALGYLFRKKILWKEGWEDVLQEPEFRERKLIYNFATLLKNFEEEIEEFEINSGIKIYIGKEIPFPKAKDFSTIISRCHFPNEEEGILAIMGPKRMTYEKNINSLNSLTKLLLERW